MLSVSLARSLALLYTVCLVSHMTVYRRFIFLQMLLLYVLFVSSAFLLYVYVYVYIYLYICIYVYVYNFYLDFAYTILIFFVSLFFPID